MKVGFLITQMMMFLLLVPPLATSPVESTDTESDIAPALVTVPIFNPHPGPDHVPAFAFVHALAPVPAPAQPPAPGHESAPDQTPAPVKVQAPAPAQGPAPGQASALGQGFPLASTSTTSLASTSTFYPTSYLATSTASTSSIAVPTPTSTAASTSSSTTESDVIWDYPDNPWAVPAHYCGPRLVAAMAHVCNHQYHTPKHWNTDTRVRRGIVDECCIAFCTYHHLQMYCAADEQ